MTTGSHQKSDFWSIFASFAAVSALFIGVIAIYVSGGDAGSGTDEAAADAPVAVTLGDLFIEPGALTVPADGSLDVSNDGASAHDLQIDGLDLGTSMIDPAGNATLDLADVPAGTHTVFCSVPGHRQAGMEATMTVTEGSTVVAAAGGDAAGGSEAEGNDMAAMGDDVDWQEMDRIMTESVADYPAETEGVGGELLEPTILPDGTKEFDLTAEIVDWEVEPGKIVKAWTYNGTVPAPTIKVDVGDKVRVNIQNDLPISTDIHWHGLHVPMDQDGVAPITQPFIEPGDSYTYEFTIDHVAVGMYHPHNHGYETVPNGMLGAILVGDLPLPGGEVPTQEMSMVLNDAGTIGFALNGKSFPATAPIVAKEGDSVLIHYMNEGLTAHPMHLHRQDQLVVAKDGFPLASPYYADTVNVAPGERYSVLIKAEEKGTWAFHCHILTHAERADGMFGMVTTMIVE